SNAFKFTPANSKVAVRLLEQEGRAIMEVSDTGPGIPAGQREVVFEKFRQLDGGSTRRFGGTGLGLAIVKEFVQLHQGSVRVDDAPAGGALFSVELPMMAPADKKVATEPQDLDSELRRQAVDELRQPAHTRLAVTGGAAANSPLVLVVEDNPDMNIYIAEALGREYRVASAGNGREGLAKAFELRPDLILSDIMMPEMSGDQLVRELRRNYEFDTTPIVLLTAKTDDHLRDTLLKDAVQDYLYKPFSAPEVLARVTRLIAERKRNEAELNKAYALLRESHAELEIRVQERTAELADANRELEAFAYTVSHDLRAPLRHILFFARLLQDQVGSNLDEESRRHLQAVVQSAERMDRLVEDLLKLSRLERAAISKVDVNLGAMVEEVRQELAQETVGREIQWHIGPLPAVQADPTLLRSVVLNLLGNAVKYTRGKQPARIEVGSQQLDGEMVFFVRDNGAGFDMKFVDKLFGVFQRLHTAQQFEGAGVGLASVRRVIQKHGGRTWAEGKVGQGATFYFSLPVGSVEGGRAHAAQELGVHTR
ncbi:MAG TPA: ATP-binding protein, partial [Clostridia bacterium]|nr:ATP-binding protein [Clostridia bacterium]